MRGSVLSGNCILSGNPHAVAQLCHPAPVRHVTPGNAITGDAAGLSQSEDLDAAEQVRR